ncbi:motility associated factor glycosyltransferase family protein [Shewanella waksmanii]|uniref:motility associated factor glycosyltransferase family protein n=1 Tax=Shewanella waksmanii TaxID=213783 RepID=UPI00048BCA0E|nr:6-hydroxymethylpterin diphosphokinase MptE-like protein [Shewanella waksmanii]
MTELFDLNLSIIDKRWPQLAAKLRNTSFAHLSPNLVEGKTQTISVDNIQLSSRHDRFHEAELLISQYPADATELYLYGIGMGDVPSLLIDIDQIRSITIYPLNLALLSLLLSYTDQSEWLSNPKVTLTEHGPDQHKLASPHIALAPDLVLADEQHASLRNYLSYEINRHFASNNHKNDPDFAARIASNRSVLARDESAAVLIGRQQYDSALVIGSGPTLATHFRYLKEQSEQRHLTKQLIICVDTALLPLLLNGIKPDIVVSIDKNILKQHLPQPLPDDVKLVYFPTIRNEIIESWPGQKYVAYATHAAYDEVSKQWPKIRLFANGSVIHPAIDLAVNMQVNELTLFGCDFSFPNNKTHTYWNQGQLGSHPKSHKHWVLNGHNQKVTTNLNFRAYLLGLEHYIRATPSVTFYQASKDGANINGCQYRECL